jgi:outer membrane protein assembly factor BamB
MQAAIRYGAPESLSRTQENELFQGEFTMANLNRLAAAAAGLVAFISIGSASAQDWPQWRGPNRDGKPTGFTAPAAWPKELKQNWRVDVGLGDATPALVAGKLYAFGRKDANEVVTCIDATNGKVLWTSSYPADYVVTGAPRDHPGPRSSPVVADGKVCTLGVGGILSCFDAATSKLLWRKQSEADYLNTPYHFETSMSPIVVDGLCIVYVGGTPPNPNAGQRGDRGRGPEAGRGPDGGRGPEAGRGANTQPSAPTGKGAIVAFDLATGQAKWKCDCNAPTPASPVVATLAGVKQIVTLGSNRAVGVSLVDHSLLWQFPFNESPTTPVIDGETVIITGQGKGTIGLKISRTGDKFTAEQAWANTGAQAAASFTTPVLRDNMLFGYTASKLSCLSAKDGTLLWADTVARGRSTAIVDAGSCLVALALSGDLLVYQPSDKQYTEIAKYKVSDPADPKAEIWAHPVLSGKTIFVKDKTSVTSWGI